MARLGAMHAGPGQIRARKNAASQIRSGKIDRAQHGLCQVGGQKSLGPEHQGPQLHLAQVGPVEPGSDQPRPALQSYWRGELTLAPPQIMTLAHLARHRSVDSALAEARGRLPALIQPHVIRDPEGRTMCYPGDALHPVRERAMPGPLLAVMPIAPP